MKTAMMIIWLISGGIDHVGFSSMDKCTAAQEKMEVGNAPGVDAPATVCVFD